MNQEGDSNVNLRGVSSSTNIVRDKRKDGEFRGGKLQIWERKTLLQGVSLLSGFNMMVVGYQKDYS
jgi:hypothetical protein